MKRRTRGLLPALALLAGVAAAEDGRPLMAEQVRRYAPPAAVYQEETLVVSDGRERRTVRTLRHYAARADGAARQLWQVKTPADASGVAIYAERGDGGQRRGAAASSKLFGSDFTLADLDDEPLQEFRYELDGDGLLERVPHAVVVAAPADAAAAARTGYATRRLYLRKDNLFVSRVEHVDAAGRVARRASFRDPRPDEAGIWRARMVLMEDLRSGESTLLVVTRRVHSPDYVPASVFAERGGGR